jgi:hypothetical protein
MRAKFKVYSVTRFNWEAVEVVLNPVMVSLVKSEEDSKENTDFWKATPNGELKMTVCNPKALDYFKPGEEYYLDFSKAEDS